MRNTTAKSVKLDNNLIREIERLQQLENRSFTNMVETLLERQVRKDENYGKRPSRL